MATPRERTELEVLLDELDRIRSYVAALLATQSAANDTYLDQKTSPLGPRRHIQAIRSGELPGFVRGRRWLARADDVREFARRLGERQVSRRQTQTGAATTGQSTVDELASELGFVAVAQHEERDR
jgi:hypothetical protein